MLGFSTPELLSIPGQRGGREGGFGCWDSEEAQAIEAETEIKEAGHDQH